jgi:hypothetical protein
VLELQHGALPAQQHIHIRQQLLQLSTACTSIALLLLLLMLMELLLLLLELLILQPLLLRRLPLLLPVLLLLVRLYVLLHLPWLLRLLPLLLHVLLPCYTLLSCTAVLVGPWLQDRHRAGSFATAHHPHCLQQQNCCQLWQADSSNAREQLLHLVQAGCSSNIVKQLCPGCLLAAC